ncbi:MAG: hypothetical protein IKF50_04895 [Clostridia bacterium]|nr:hypothetical protein [Clostridia bacterium]
MHTKTHGVRIIAIVSWTIAVMAYFFQFPVSFLSSLIIPFLGLYVVLTILSNRTYLQDIPWFKLYFVYLAYLSIMAIVSVFGNSGIGSVLRFFAALAAIPLCCMTEEKRFHYEYRTFLLFAVLKSLVLLGFAAYMLYTGTYEPLRRWAYRNSFGDIYINPNDHLPRVQVHGNGILPMAFILNDTYRKGKRNDLINFILLLGILAAGNFAYILAIAVFYLLKMLKYITTDGKPVVRKLILVLCLSGAAIVFLWYAFRQMAYKAEGSNSIRLEQAQVLLSDSNLLLGKGLGHGIYYTGLRTYQGETYFELQTLYILNQIGLAGMVLFYALVFRPIWKTGKRETILFLIYLLYTFWNPYCFDSTEMIVILMLINYGAYAERFKTPDLLYEAVA